MQTGESKDKSAAKLVTHPQADSGRSSNCPAPVFLRSGPSHRCRGSSTGLQADIQKGMPRSRRVPVSCSRTNARS
eukprot:3801558-Rhodomonas_salina.3